MGNFALAALEQSIQKFELEDVETAIWIFQKFDILSAIDIFPTTTKESSQKTQRRLLSISGDEIFQISLLTDCVFAINCIPMSFLRFFVCWVFFPVI